MSKSKTNGVAVIDAPVSETQLSLLKVDFDSIESIESVEIEAREEAAPAADVTEDSEEQILATVESFDKTYGNDPLEDEWLAFGQTIKQRTDNARCDLLSRARPRTQQPGLQRAQSWHQFIRPFRGHEEGRERSQTVSMFLRA